FNERVKAHEDTVKQLQTEKKDTEKERVDFQNWARAHQLGFHDQEIKLLERHIAETKALRDAAGADEKATLDKLDGELQSRLKQSLDQRRMLSESAMGVTTIGKPDDYEKLYGKAQDMVDKLKASIAGNRAELAGASNDYAKFIYMLEEAAKKKLGPLDNTEVA